MGVALLALGGALAVSLYEATRASQRSSVFLHYCAWIGSMTLAAFAIGAVEALRTGEADQFLPALFFGPVIGLAVAAATRRRI